MSSAERGDRSMVSRRTALSILGAPVLGGSRARAAQARRPNVIVILSDDQGWGDLSIHGNSNLSTPNLDSLGREGAMFRHFYVCALCAPTRAEFLTGRYHPRSGVRGVSTGAERMNTDEVTIAETFKAAGYATAIFGKWHNGTQHPYHPNARGFDEFYGFTEGHWGQYFDAELDHNGKLVRGKGYIADDITDHALAWIEQPRNRPFFCYLAYNIPHSPMQVPGRFWRKFANFEPKLRVPEEDVAMTRAALAMCENLDWNVGRVLAHLRQWELDRDTIVVFFCDNGPNSWRWNGGMKGRKGSVDEGGLRSPLFIRWPGRIRAGLEVTRIAGAIDLLPTLADLAGVPLISRKPLDGLSLRPLLFGESKSWPDRMIFSLNNRRVSVRTQQYRMDPQGRLYDIPADPGQQRDLAAERPEVAARLRRAMEQWAAEMLPLVGPDDRPFPVGHAPFTLLPARDGVPHGGIRRSASAPNCSYFTNWTSTDGRITWSVEVAEAGDYEVEIYYAAPEPGALLELSFGGARVQRRITEPWNPPLIGAEFDRVPRQESYVKDFRPFSLGLIRLPQGRGELVLRALEIPGRQAAEIRYLALTRK
ncbi:MAG: arylsulfatase [Bryobacteraceae bacterium]